MSSRRSYCHERPTGALGWLGVALTEVVGAEQDVRAFDLASVDFARENIDFNGKVMFGSVTDFDQRHATERR